VFASRVHHFVKKRWRSIRKSWTRDYHLMITSSRVQWNAAIIPGLQRNILVFMLRSAELVKSWSRDGNHEFTTCEWNAIFFSRSGELGMQTRVHEFNGMQRSISSEVGRLCYFRPVTVKCCTQRHYWIAAGRYEVFALPCAFLLIQPGDRWKLPRRIERIDFPATISRRRCLLIF